MSMAVNTNHLNEKKVEYLEAELAFLKYEIKRAERYIGMNEDEDSQKCSRTLLRAIQ